MRSLPPCLGSSMVSIIAILLMAGVTRGVAAETNALLQAVVVVQKVKPSGIMVRSQRWQVVCKITEVRAGSGTGLGLDEAHQAAPGAVFTFYIHSPVMTLGPNPWTGEKFLIDLHKSYSPDYRGGLAIRKLTTGDKDM